MLTFDEPSHTYCWNGVVVPGVTTIMGKLRDFAGIPPELLDFASDRGRKVHKACHLDDDGLLDDATLDDRLKPYIDAWRLFTQREKPEWAVSERPLYDPSQRYAGTPDRAGYALGECGVFEIKAVAQLHPAFGVQLAGYKRLLVADAHFDPIYTKRFAIQLLKTGQYRVEEYKDRTDEVMFTSALNLHHWKERNHV